MRAQQFQTIVQQAADGSLVVDADGVVLFANPACEVLLGRAAAELTGTSLGQPIVVDGTTEMDILRKNGELVTVEMRATEITWGGAPAVLASLRDVSERVRAAAQVEHLNSVLRAIRSVNQLIVREKDPTALAQKACELLIETRGYTGAWIAVGDGRSPATVFAQAGWEKEFASFADLLRQGKWPPCMDKCLASDEVFAGHNPALSCQSCPLSKTCEDRGSLVTKLSLSEKMQGLMGVSIAGPSFDDEEERSLLSQVGQDIAFALHNIEIERRQRQTQWQLQRAVEAGAVGLWDWDLATNQVFFSSEWKAQIGHRPEEIGDSFEEWAGRVHPDDLEPTRERIQTALKPPHPPYRAEFRLRHKDGTYRWIDARGSLEFDANGQPAKLGGTHVDVTLRRMEEDKNRQAQQVAHLGHWELDACDGAPVWSDEIFRIFGIEPGVGEPSFTSHDTIIHPEEWPLLDDAIRAGFENGTPFDLVFRILRPGQETGWMHAIGNATRDAGGKVVRMFGTAQDITKGKEAEDDLRESRQLLEGILDTIPVRVFWKDKNLVFLGCNAAFARDAGFASPRDVIGKDDFQMCWSAQADLYRSADRQVIESGQAQLLMEEPQTDPGGGTLTLLTSKMPLRNAAGEVTGVLGTYMNITELKELQAQLAQADRLSSMGMLAAGVAHEINNPLSYVLYNLESLTEDLPELLAAVRKTQTELDNLSNTSDVDEKLGPLLELMNPVMLDDILARFKDALEGTHRIRDVSRGLGTFSRVEKDQLVPVNLTHVIEAALSMAFNEIKYRARLVKEYGSKVPTVMASEGRLSQVFLNLIINATHAVDEGDLENNEIRVKTWAEGEQVCAQVRDTGSGIAPENLGKLFEPFFTTKKIGVGSGLGLAISKDIVEGYGGTIEVESEVGTGTCFTIRLPARALAARAEVAAKADEKPVLRGRILIVDDEDGIRAAMVRMLRQHETVQAASGAEAKEILESDPDFDLILCDMMMPDVTGMDLHEWLSERHPELAEQLIFITGGAFTPRAREYLSRVDNLRLEKPFDMANFIKIVRDRIHLAKLTQSA